MEVGKEHIVDYHVQDLENGGYKHERVLYYRGNPTPELPAYEWRDPTLVRLRLRQLADLTRRLMATAQFRQTGKTHFMAQAHAALDREIRETVALLPREEEPPAYRWGETPVSPLDPFHYPSYRFQARTQGKSVSMETMLNQGRQLALVDYLNWDIKALRKQLREWTAQQKLQARIPKVRFIGITDRSSPNPPPYPARQGIAPFPEKGPW
jgi:hypothetical protein